MQPMDDVIAVLDGALLRFPLRPTAPLGELAERLAAAGERPGALTYVAVRLARRVTRAA
jgi:hypothetical protein